MNEKNADESYTSIGFKGENEKFSRIISDYNTSTFDIFGDKSFRKGSGKKLLK